jgi:nicotinamidase-related amidase
MVVLVSSRAVLVLDLFDDLVGPEGVSAGSGYPEQVADRDVIDKVRDVVDVARAAGGLVVWVTGGFEPDYLDWPAPSPLFGGAKASGGFLKDTSGTSPLPELHRDVSEPLIVKPRVSPFFGTRLEQLLRTAGVTEVFLVGVATEHVVLAAARDAHDRDFHVTVLADAVASSTSELHDAGLLVMESYTRQIPVHSFAAAISNNTKAVRV